MDNKLLQRYIEGDVTTQEADEVVDWLDADSKHVQEFMALHKVYDITVMNQQTAIPKEDIRRIGLRRIYKEIAKVAAIVLFVLGVQYGINIMSTEKLAAPLYQTLYVPAGQRAELLLPDSTKVWLNAHSRLVYPVNFQKESRAVELEGEAYFEVKRNEKAPFTVRTSQMDIKVLGTEFNVFAYPEKKDFEVALLKGCVELQILHQSSTYQMKPGELIRYKEGKYLSRQIQEPDYFKWKDGLICFHDQPISDIIDKLSLYFDIEIEVQSSQFLKEHYTGKFRTKDGVEQVLKVLQREHRFVYRKDNDQNKIIIK